MVKPSAEPPMRLGNHRLMLAAVEEIWPPAHSPATPAQNSSTQNGVVGSCTTCPMPKIGISSASVKMKVVHMPPILSTKKVCGKRATAPMSSAIAGSQKR